MFAVSVGWNYFDSEEFWYPDIWYHIAYTYDGSTISLYKDGTLNNSKADSRDFTFNNFSFSTEFRLEYAGRISSDSSLEQMPDRERYSGRNVTPDIRRFGWFDWVLEV